MNHATEYKEGWHEGRQWAEDDLRNHRPTDRGDRFRHYMLHESQPPTSNSRAWGLGIVRGYRDTIARFESGELTWEMFDTAPLGT